MLSCHRQQDLFERIRVIVNEGQDPTKPIHKVVEEATINLGLDAIDEEGQVARYGDKGLGSDSYSGGLVSLKSKIVLRTKARFQYVPSATLCLPLFQISFGGYPSHTTAFFWQFRHLVPHRISFVSRRGNEFTRRSRS